MSFHVGVAGALHPCLHACAAKTVSTEIALQLLIKVPSVCPSPLGNLGKFRWDRWGLYFFVDHLLNHLTKFGVQNWGKWQWGHFCFKYYVFILGIHLWLWTIRGVTLYKHVTQRLFSLCSVFLFFFKALKILFGNIQGSIFPTILIHGFWHSPTHSFGKYL